ncbi:MAG: hypothetical protein HC915_19055 [Anaerolineae bacterium]|nr:hypothetical protein [Anaerolineae bacterium]
MLVAGGGAGHARAAWPWRGVWRWGGDPNLAPPTVQIIAPQSGQQVVVGDAVDIQIAAQDAVGITFLQLQVANRVSSTKSFPEPATQAEALLRWQPDRRGTFALSVVAYRDGVASEPATLSLEVVGRGETVTNPASGQPQAAPLNSTDCRGRVLIDNLRVRTGPGTNYSSSGRYALNEQVTVLGTNLNPRGEEWLLVRRASGEAWLIRNTDWVELSGACSSLPALSAN